ncbi:hypothetical protein BDZ89DRAFT_780016 [Hymenopellis radicata]|nr:hypothetical protein BDZ89DRAFT_780016 [Hymenopellis radicata]
MRDEYPRAMARGHSVMHDADWVVEVEGRVVVRVDEVVVVVEMVMVVVEMVMVVVEMEMVVVEMVMVVVEMEMVVVVVVVVVWVMVVCGLWSLSSAAAGPSARSSCHRVIALPPHPSSVHRHQSVVVVTPSPSSPHPSRHRHPGVVQGRRCR